MTRRSTSAVAHSLTYLLHRAIARRRAATLGAASALAIWFGLAGSADAGLATGTLPGDPDQCPVTVIVRDGDPAPGGGSFDANFFNVPGINEAGDLAFVSRLNGTTYDHGLFVRQGDTIRLIVRGCDVGACGDPTPAGGTYRDFIAGSVSPPVINDSGDIVFTARINGGPTEVGHFLYRAATGVIEKVVAAGDPSPRGGVIDVLGGATLNNAGDVVFGAWDVSASSPYLETYLLRWRDDQLEKIIAPGDAVPGGVAAEVGGSHFIVDGFSFLVSPAPFLGEDGRILVNVESSGRHGILEILPDSNRWIVRSGDPAPGGGTLSVFESAPLRGGLYTFSSDSVAGIFTGTPGEWQSVWRDGDTVDGAPVTGFLRLSGLLPVQDAGGQITSVLEVEPTPGFFADRLVRWNAADGLFTLTTSGDPAPGGGTMALINSFTQV
ncbi:MAG: choice-of-anchor tandem repeat NxxGxxAF-containing protein, partial [Acidobacteriota bacterium]